jgi:hypothetical protein
MRHWPFRTDAKAFAPQLIWEYAHYLQRPEHCPGTYHTCDGSTHWAAIPGGRRSWRTDWHSSPRLPPN